MSDKDQRTLRNIAANPDVSRYAQATIDRLNMDRLVRVVFDDDKGKVFAHLTDRGRRVADL